MKSEDNKSYQKGVKMMRFIIAMSLSLLFGFVMAGCGDEVGGSLNMTSKAQISCSEDADCNPMGFCGPRGICLFECQTDEDCGHLGERYICENRLCEVGAETTDIPCDYMAPETCLEYGWPASCADKACLDYGFAYSCQPNGKCIDNGEVDLGEVNDDSNAADYVGVWGGMLTTAVRNGGLPLVDYMDTSSLHLMLVRIKQEGDGLVMHSHLCFLEINNIDVEEDIIDNSLAHMEVPLAYMKNVSTLEHHIQDVPAISPGAILTTNRHWEARGIKLDNIATDPLATFYDIEAGNPVASLIWDQDKDGKLAMTTNMVGLLEGEIYSNQKWSTKFDFEVIDKNHIEAVSDTTNEQYQLGAEPSMLMAPDFRTDPHPEEDRSYFRLMRMWEDATCEDVIEEANNPMSYLTFTMHIDGPWPGPVAGQFKLKE